MSSPLLPRDQAAPACRRDPYADVRFALDDLDTGPPDQRLLVRVLRTVLDAPEGAAVVPLIARQFGFPEEVPAPPTVQIARAIGRGVLVGAISAGALALVSVATNTPRLWPGVVIGFLATGAMTFLHALPTGRRGGGG